MWTRRPHSKPMKKQQLDVAIFLIERIDLKYGCAMPPRMSRVLPYFLKSGFLEVPVRVEQSAGRDSACVAAVTRTPPRRTHEATRHRELIRSSPSGSRGRRTSLPPRCLRGAPKSNQSHTCLLASRQPSVNQPGWQRYRGSAAPIAAVTQTIFPDRQGKGKVIGFAARREMMK